MVSRRNFLASLLALPLATKGPTMPTEIPYSDSKSVILSGTGAGSVTFNGPPSLTTRVLSNIVVQCSGSSPRPRVQVYRSIVAPNRLMGTSLLGDSDTLIADPGDELQSGEPLIVVWTGGPAGAQCYANVNGTDRRA